MRLDKYLKVSRLIKRRTVANEACDNERVMVNGRVIMEKRTMLTLDEERILYEAARCAERLTK